MKQHFLKQKVLVLMMTFGIFLGFNNKSLAQCEITVTVSSPSWGDATTWTLTDEGGAIILSGGTYANGYSDTQTVPSAAAGNYTFTVVSNLGDNMPNYNITLDGDVVFNGTGAANQTTVVGPIICAPVEVPPNPVQEPGIPTCALGTELSVPGTPLPDNTWYWQTDAEGTSMANNADTPWTVFANGTYYVRAYDSNIEAWSTAASITVTNFPLETTPPTPLGENPACLPGTEISMPAPPADVLYYWQTTVNGVSTANPATTPLFITETGMVYVSAFNTVTQCWSETADLSVTINTNVPPNVAADPDVFNFCPDASPMNISVVELPPSCAISINVFSATWGDGTTWTVTNSLGQVVLSGGPYGNGYSDTQTIPEATDSPYTLTINSTFGDNIPSYSVTVDGDVVFSGVGIAGGTTVVGPFGCQIGGDDIAWFSAPSGGDFLGNGATLNALGTSVLPIATLGTYEFYAANLLGSCESLERTLVTLNVVAVDAELISIDNTCNGGTAGSFSLGTVNCGTAPFTYSVDGSAFGAIPNNLAAGTYSVVIEDASSDLSGPITVVITEPNPVSNLSANVLSATEVELSWTNSGSEGSWNIEYGPVGFTPGTGTVLEALNNPTTVDGLTPSTDYDFYVQSVCGPLAIGDYSEPVSAATPQIPVSDFPWSEGFETGGTEWTILNGIAVNKWFVGDVVSASGTESLYVSDSDGATNTYNGTAFSVVHAYRDIAFPATPGEAQLSFQWKCFGESSFDYLQVWLVPIDYVPTPGNLFGDAITAFNTGDPATQRINLTGNLNLQTNWQTWQGLIPTEYYGSTARLVFQWRNDGSVTNQPPAAVDNVSIIIGDCPRPNPVTVTDVTQNSALVSWTPGTVGDDEWVIEYGPQGFQFGTGTQITVNTNPYLLEGLDNSTFYSLVMRTVCDVNDSTFSIYSPVVNFQTQFGCGGTFVDDGGLLGNYPANQNKIYTICPDDAGDYVEVIFDAFATQVQFDGFYIYYGDEVNIDNIIPSGNPAGFAPLNAPNAWWGNQLTGMTFESLGAGECLTFHWLSNGFTELAGWEAPIGCFPCFPTPGVDGEADICRLDEVIDLNTVVTLNSDRGFWTFPSNPGLVFDESMLNVALMPEGTFELYYIVNTPCTSDTTVATIHIYPPSSAGNSGSLINCNNGVINLYEGLDGNIDLGGQWYTPGGEELSSSLVQVDGQLSGVYNYYYITSNGVCPADTSYSEVTLQNCVGLTENEIAGFELYPNPTADVVFLSYGGDNLNTTVYLIDAKGSVISVEERLFETNSTFEINMTDLQSGAYFVTIVSETGKNIIQVVKQ